MKTFLSALVVVCAALAPEAWTFIPQFRADVLQVIHWVNDSPIWIFAALIAVILLNHYLVGREGK